MTNISKKYSLYKFSSENIRVVAVLRCSPSYDFWKKPEFSTQEKLIVFRLLTPSTPPTKMCPLLPFPDKNETTHTQDGLSMKTKKNVIINSNDFSIVVYLCVVRAVTVARRCIGY